jgi:ribonuclease R
LRETLTVAIDGPNAQVIDDALTLERTGQRPLATGHSHFRYCPLCRAPFHPLTRKPASGAPRSIWGTTSFPCCHRPYRGPWAPCWQGKDRLAMSVLVTLDDTGQVLEYEVQPAVVNVDHQITYQQAQAVLERDNSDTLQALDIKPKELKALEPIFDLMDNLLYLSQAIKRQRLQRGAFELNLPEYDFPDDAGELLAHYRSPKFQYDDEGLLGVIGHLL